MSSLGDTLPAKRATAATARLRFTHLLLPVGYFTAVAVAMAGWLWALAWTMLATVKWLFA